MSVSSSTKPIYLRGIPGNVVREAKAIAARRGVTLASFVTDAIVRAIRHYDEPVNAPPAVALAPNHADDAPDATGDDLVQDMRWYEENRDRLAKELSGEYAAIVDQEVIDHDADFEALAKRAFARCGLRNVFMPLVGPVQRAPRVRSPRLDGARLQPSRATRSR